METFKELLTGITLDEGILDTIRGAVGLNKGTDYTIPDKVWDGFYKALQGYIKGMTIDKQGSVIQILDYFKSMAKKDPNNPAAPVVAKIWSDIAAAKQKGNTKEVWANVMNTIMMQAKKAEERHTHNLTAAGKTLMQSTERSFADKLDEALDSI